MSDRIPDAIISATVSMLAPYVPGLTVERLLMVIGPVPESEPEKLYTRREAAEVLRVSMPTIDRLLRDEDLAKLKIRGSVRIPSSAIERILHGQCAS